MKTLIAYLLLAFFGAISASAGYDVKYVSKYKLEINADLSAKVVLHTYDAATGQGTVSFDTPITEARHFWLDSSNGDITEMTFPNTVESVANYAFTNCINITSIDLGPNVKTVGSYAFNNCMKLTTLNMGSKIETVGNRAFYNCQSLTSIVLPEGLTRIGDSAFSGCSKMETVDLPSTLTYLGSNVFERNTALTEVRCRAEEPPTLKNDKVFPANEGLKIRVANKVYDEYAQTWAPLRDYLAFADDILVNFIAEGGDKYASLSVPDRGYGQVFTIHISAPQTIRVEALTLGPCQFLNWYDGNQEPVREFAFDSKSNLKYVITARFEVYDILKGQCVTATPLSTQVGSVTGSIYGAPARLNKFFYSAGTVITLNAKAAPGYVFTQWSDGDTNANRQLTVGTGSNVVLNAYFRPENLASLWTTIAGEYGVQTEDFERTATVNDKGSLVYTVKEDGFEDETTTIDLNKIVYGVVPTPFGYSVWCDKKVFPGFSVRVRNGRATHLFFSDDLCMYPVSELTGSPIDSYAADMLDCKLDNSYDSESISHSAILSYVDPANNTHLELYNTVQQSFEDFEPVIEHKDDDEISDTFYIEAHGNNVIAQYEDSEAEIISCGYGVTLDICLPLPTDTLTLICGTSATAIKAASDIRVHGKGLLRIFAPESIGFDCSGDVYYTDGVNIEIYANSPYDPDHIGAAEKQDGNLTIIRDANGDGNINLKDIDVIQQRIFSNPEDKGTKIDADGNGIISITDLTRIVRFLNFKNPFSW